MLQALRWSSILTVIHFQSKLTQPQGSCELCSESTGSFATFVKTFWFDRWILWLKSSTSRSVQILWWAPPALCVASLVGSASAPMLPFRCWAILPSCCWMNLQVDWTRRCLIPWWRMSNKLPNRAVLWWRPFTNPQKRCSVALTKFCFWRLDVSLGEHVEPSFPNVAVQIWWFSYMVTWCTFSFSNPQRTSERLSACSPLIFPSRVFNCQVAYYGPIANLRSSLSNLGFACPEGTPLPELLLDLLEMPADESVRPAHSEKLEKLKKLSEPWMKEGMPRCIINFVPPNFLTNSMNQRKALNVRACIIREDVSIISIYV